MSKKDSVWHYVEAECSRIIGFCRSKKQPRNLVFRESNLCESHLLHIWPTIVTRLISLICQEIRYSSHSTIMVRRSRQTLARQHSSPPPPPSVPSHPATMLRRSSRILVRQRLPPPPLPLLPAASHQCPARTPPDLLTALPDALLLEITEHLPFDCGTFGALLRVNDAGWNISNPGRS